MENFLAGNGSSILLIVGMIAIMYFLMIRPQQQQRKRHQEMIGALSRGDYVILQGGLYGKITKVDEENLEIEIAPEVIVRQVKSMIVAVTEKPAAIKTRKSAKKDA